jgi:predicted dehydrogenase
MLLPSRSRHAARRAPFHSTNPATRLTRRQALAACGVALVPAVLPGRVFGAAAPSKQITLGCVGLGMEGFNHNLKTFLVQDDARVLAVCDTFASRRQQGLDEVAKHYGGCRAYADFRDVLARRDIDAIVISTPDHWHVPMSLLALEAGKDVFCEKPTLTIAEGRTLVQAVARRKAVFEVGLEDRSTIYYYKLAELVRNGAIGRLQKIHVKLPSGTAYPIEKPAAVPAGLNWNMWLGPAPFHPFTPHRADAMFWRQVRDYSGGLLTDWGAHIIDTAQVANFAERSGPVEIEGVGEIPKNSAATTFVNFGIHYRYANGVEMFVQSGGVALRFEGTDGWVGNNGWCGRVDGSAPELVRRKYPREGNKLWPMPPSEHRNFLDCVKSRQPTTYTAEDYQRLATTLHLGNIAMTLGRKVVWDPASESFPGDAAANALCRRESREDWKK